MAEEYKVTAAPRGVPLPEVEIHIFKAQTSPEAVKVLYGAEHRWAEVKIFGELQEDRAKLIEELVSTGFKYLSNSNNRVTSTVATTQPPGIWRWEITSAIEPQKTKTQNSCLARMNFRRYGWKPEGTHRAKNSVQA